MVVQTAAKWDVKIDDGGEIEYTQNPSKTVLRWTKEQKWEGTGPVPPDPVLRRFAP